MSFNNPFEQLGEKLNSIESLLFQIQQQIPGAPIDNSKKDIGGVNIAIEETGLSSNSVYRLVSERRIPHSKRGGRLYFSRKALQQWINEGERKGGRGI